MVKIVKHEAYPFGSCFVETIKYATKTQIITINRYSSLWRSYSLHRFKINTIVKLPKNKYREINDITND